MFGDDYDGEETSGDEETIELDLDGGLDGDDDEDDEDEESDETSNEESDDEGDDENDDDEDESDEDIEQDFEEYLDQIENDEEEGEEDDEEDDEDDNEEGKEDDDPKSRFDEIDDEEEGEEDEDIFEEKNLDDDSLYVALTSVKTYNEWIKLAEDQGNEIDMGFARQVVQHDISPSMLAENSIYNFSDLMSHLETLQEAVGEDALLVPKQDDEEAWKVFNKEVNNIPDNPDGYPAELFSGTFLEENEEGQNLLRQEFASIGASVNVAQGLINILDNERRGVDEAGKTEFLSYRKEQDEILQDEYGEDYKNHLRENKRFLDAFPSGKELLNLFGKTKYFASSAWFNFLTEIRESGEVSKPKFTMRTFQRTVKALTDESLVKRYNTLLQNKFLDEKYDGHSDGVLAKKHAKLYRLASNMQAEIEKRGLQ